MPSYDQTPGSLSLAFVSGDDFSTLVDFSIDMTGYAVEAEILSAVTGTTVLAFTVAIQSAANGQVSLSLSDSQTAGLKRGTYRWAMRWAVAGVTRTALVGYVEVS